MMKYRFSLFKSICMVGVKKYGKNPDGFDFVGNVGVIQRCRDVNRDVYICFLDYTKAFDMCIHVNMVGTLRNAGVYEKGIRVVVNFYSGQRVM